MAAQSYPPPSLVFLFFSFFFYKRNEIPKVCLSACCFQGGRWWLCLIELSCSQTPGKKNKLTWKGLLIPMYLYVFLREGLIKGLIFCVPGARLKPSFLVGFSYALKSRLILVTYSPTMCCIIIALLGCAGV